MSGLVDGKAREQIRTELDRNIIVEAAAGTGKTTELVNRIIAVLASGRARVDSVVAVTFTEKAAGELKLRMRAGLEKARRDAGRQGERANLEEALARLEEARVGTIHGFCSDVLRERSLEAQVDPEFQVLTEPEADRLYREAFQFWLQEKLQDPPEGVRRSLRRSAKYSQEGPAGRLRQAGWTLAEWRDFPTAWRRDPFPREAAVDGLVLQLHAFAELSANCSDPKRDNLFLDTAPVRRLSEAIKTAEAVRMRDHDGLEAAFVDLGDYSFRNVRKGRGETYGPGVKRKDVQAAHADLAAALSSFSRAADADLAALLQQELQEVTAAYQRLKERSGALDFVDLLARARNLIRDDATVRAEFQERFTHIFIDEFQDTDPLQAEILLLLASADPSVRDWRAVVPRAGKLFLVADPKQSIYRFRRADVGVYLDVKEMLIGSGTLPLNLTTSFRAVPVIQHTVNAAFSKAMTGDREAFQADYVPLAPHRDAHEGQPAVIALPVPRPYGAWGRVTQKAIEASLPDAVGAFVKWLLKDSGWTVTERENPRQRVPIQARHVCLLFRRFDSFFAGEVTRGYVSALESRGIRHLLVGGKSFQAREEVEILRTALSAIEWPDDELSVFATLRGPLLAIGDEELLEYRHLHRHLHPFRVPPGELPERLQPIAESLRLLAGLHRERNRRPVAETVSLLLELTRAHAGFVLRPSGEQALANVLHIADQARSYESTGGISFRGFVERLIEEADGPGSAEAPILEEGSEGVRIMTVHKAKGLEFPVVILADIGAALSRNAAGRTIDPERKLAAMRISGWAPVELLENERDEVRRDTAESIRLAYVAATRARDLLVLPALGDDPFTSGWTGPLNHAIYPPPARRAHVETAPGCPAFGNDTVLDREQTHFGGHVRPGLHRFDTHDVVWWDPAALELDVPPLYGVLRSDLIARDTDAEVVAADRRRHEAWQADRATALAGASQPGIRLRTATEHAAESGADRLDVQVVKLPIESSRPSGPRFGAVVHALLASVPLDADPAEVRQVATLQGRLLGAPAAEVDAAVHVVTRALRHPLLERASRALAERRCRRETPVTLIVAGGGLVDGVVDLAFLEDGVWTVIDFKTDRNLEAQLPAYRTQVGLYADAIKAATGEPAVAVLLRV